MRSSIRQDDRRSVAVVTTTVNVPCFFDDMLSNAAFHGHADQLSVTIVGDRKTPAEVGEYVADLGRNTSASINYLDLSAQRALLRKFPTLDMILRYDSTQRRNVGFLQAAIDGAEVIISVDDDNYVTDDDFIGHHLAVGTSVEVPVVSDKTGWWNVCRRLTCDPPRQFYHRGYPKSQQSFIDTEYEVQIADVRAVVNAGLWLETPDVDADAHIAGSPNVVAMEPIAGQRTCALAQGTWCPVNSQNSAFSAELLPAMYLAVMDEPVGGQRIMRMDDIWLSYFVRAIADKLGDSFLYGPPLVRQERNRHDNQLDLAGETPGYALTERIVEYLCTFTTEETTYGGAYLDLIYHLRESSQADNLLEEGQREYLRRLTVDMAAWHTAIRSL